MQIFLRKPSPFYYGPPPKGVPIGGPVQGSDYYFPVVNESDCSGRGMYWCSEGQLCVPVYVVCNGVYDCPDGQDEDSCDGYTCPGYYRCRQSRICLRAEQVCDGYYQCPEQDDEWYCGLRCPTQCACHGNSYTCEHRLVVEGYPFLRYLNASGSGLTPEHFFNNTMLIYLSLEHCNVTNLHLPALPNLVILDVNHNNIEAVALEHLTKVANLKMLSLAGNPLTALFTSSAGSVETFPELKIMDLSMVTISHLNVSLLTPFSGLTSLNLSGSATRRVSGGAFSHPELRVLDMRGWIGEEFPQSLLQDLKNVKALYADSYKICCGQSLPAGFNPKDCHAPQPVISSCHNLLGSNVQRTVVFLLAAVTVLGNWTNLVIATRRRQVDRNSSVFAPHLFLSKSVMGVYLAVLSVADQVYSGDYLWRDVAWRSGSWCSMCGFLFFLSSQVSVFVVVCMTLERCAVLAWADRSAHCGRMVKPLMCVGSWVGGAVLATVPAASPWNDFSQTSLCVPLPVSQGRLSGHPYALGVLVVLNTTLMLLTAAGQTYIYVTVRRNFMVCFVDSQRSREFAAARRLLSVAVADACCWFVFALWVLLTSQGSFVSSNVTSVMAVFVVYVNSALTPYHYLLNIALERNTQLQRQRLLKRLQYKLTGEESKDV